MTSQKYQLLLLYIAVWESTSAIGLKESLSCCHIEGMQDW